MYATKLCSCLDAGYGASRFTGQVMGVANVLHYAFPFIPKVRSIQVIPGRCGWMLCEFLDVWLENSILYRYWKTLCCLYFCGFQAAFFFDCHYIINWWIEGDLVVLWALPILGLPGVLCQTSTDLAYSEGLTTQQRWIPPAKLSFPRETQNPIELQHVRTLLI